MADSAANPDGSLPGADPSGRPQASTNLAARQHTQTVLREIVEGTSPVTGDEFFHALVRHLARALDVPVALVGEVRDDSPGRLYTLAFWAQDGFAAEIDYDLATTPCGEVCGKGPVLCGDGLAERFPQAGCVLQLPGACSYYGQPLFDAAGRALGVLAIMDKRPMPPSEERDSLMAIFAARAGAELARLRAEAEVRKSGQRLARIFQISPLAISVSRVADGRYLEVNEAYGRQLGWTMEEVVGRSSLELGLWAHPDDRLRWIAELDQQGRVVDYELVFRNRHGEPRDFLVSAERLDFNGEPCILAFLYDITERKQAEQAIRRINAELEERVRQRTEDLTDANRELESFAYSMSHDLRAPLRGIDGFSRLLQEEYGDRLEAQGGEYLRRVRLAAQRLGTLIDDLLELSRVSRKEMQTIAVDLSALAHAVVDELSKSEPQRRVAVHVEPACVAEGDPQLLRILVENLLGNAWKYTARTPDARIEFGSENSAHGPGFFIRDNGAGFDMAYAHKLFAPFQRLHNPAEFEGSGIGLASAARVIRRHGGRIWAEGSPGRGAIFHFALGGR